MGFNSAFKGLNVVARKTCNWF